MTTELKISAFSKIKDNEVYENHQLVFHASEIRAATFLVSIYDHLQINYPKFYKMDVLSKAGIICSELILKNFEHEKYKKDHIGIVLMNRNGSIEADDKYWDSVKVIPSPALFVYTLPNIVIGEISIKHKIKGENAFFIQDRFDAHWMHYYVTDLMTRFNTDACICGWVDVIENDVDACFFLIEKQKMSQSIVFSPENLKLIYQN